MAITGAVPYLWFDHEALEAATFWTGLFPDSRIVSVSHYREGAPLPEGTVLVVQFELFGRPYAALNGGPHATHSDAVSFEVLCDTQEELDRVWDALVADGGEESMCGWCRDRFGVSWQVVPRVLVDLLDGPDDARAQRTWDAMLTMQRLDIAAIVAAADGSTP
jgi:predicted 3-demethylubiquinone-9 3-methyltransferase (glyoxalase superfamily)